MPMHRLAQAAICNVSVCAAQSTPMLRSSHLAPSHIAHPAAVPCCRSYCVCAAVIVHFYSWLLQQYRANSPFTNHALTSFLARIADPRGLNLEPMLYQVLENSVMCFIFKGHTCVGIWDII